MKGVLQRVRGLLSKLRHDQAIRVPGRFYIPPRNVPLPQCRFRPFADADFDACKDIYRLNEPGRFPPGYFDYFSGWLRSGRDLVLICEVDGEVRGFGGINMHQKPELESAALNFGMIRPEHHKQGYGTASLFARIALLPPPNSQWLLYITTTGGSETFFKRFGFLQTGSFKDEFGTEFDQYQTWLHKDGWQACRDALAAASITLDTAVIPPSACMQASKP